MMDGGTKGGDVDYEFSQEVVPLWPWDYHHYEPPGSVNHTYLFNCHPKNPCESCERRRKEKETGSEGTLLWTPPPSPPLSTSSLVEEQEVEEEEEEEEDDDDEEEKNIIPKVVPLDLELSITMFPGECRVHPGSPCFICSEATDELLRLASWISRVEEVNEGREEEEEKKTMTKTASATTNVIKSSSATCSSSESDCESSKLERTFKAAQSSQGQSGTESTFPSWTTVSQGSTSYQSLMGDTYGQPLTATQSLGSQLAATSTEDKPRVPPPLQPPPASKPNSFVPPRGNNTNTNSSSSSCGCSRPMKCSYGSTSAHADLNINFQPPLLPGPPPTMIHVPYHRLQSFSYAPQPYFPAAISCPPPAPPNFYHGVHMNYINQAYPYVSHHLHHHHHIPTIHGTAADTCRKVQLVQESNKKSQEKLNNVDDASSRKSLSAPGPGGTPTTGSSPRGFQLKSHEFPSLSAAETGKSSTKKGLVSAGTKKKQKAESKTLKKLKTQQVKEQLAGEVAVTGDKNVKIETSEEGTSDVTTIEAAPVVADVEEPSDVVTTGEEESEKVAEPNEINNNEESTKTEGFKLPETDQNCSDHDAGLCASVQEPENVVQVISDSATDLAKDTAVPEVEASEVLLEVENTCDLGEDAKATDGLESEGPGETDDPQAVPAKEKKKTGKLSKKAAKKARKLAAKAAKVPSAEAIPIKSSVSDSKLTVRVSSPPGTRKHRRDLNPDMRIPRSMRMKALEACRRNLSTVDSDKEEPESGQSSDEREFGYDKSFSGPPYNSEANELKQPRINVSDQDSYSLRQRRIRKQRKGEVESSAFSPFEQDAGVQTD